MLQKITKFLPKRSPKQVIGLVAAPILLAGMATAYQTANKINGKMYLHYLFGNGQTFTEKHLSPNQIFDLQTLCERGRLAQPLGKTPGKRMINTYAPLNPATIETGYVTAFGRFTCLEGTQGKPPKVIDHYNFSQYAGIWANQSKGFIRDLWTCLSSSEINGKPTETYIDKARAFIAFRPGEEYSVEITLPNALKPWNNEMSKRADDSYPHVFPVESGGGKAWWERYSRTKTK